MKHILNILSSLGGILVSLAYSCFIWGFISFKFYNWFFYEKLNDMPFININLFIALSLFLQAIFPKQLITKSKDEYLDIYFELTNHYIMPWIVFLFGYLFHSLFY